jgi:tetratricopeptide (TPR) repeat protein
MIVVAGMLAAGAAYGQEKPSATKPPEGQSDSKLSQEQSKSNPPQDQSGSKLPRSKDDPCAVANKALSNRQFDAARIGYEGCLKDVPPTKERLSNLGMAYAGISDLGKAMTAYRQALALDPNDPTVHLNLGLALFKSGHVQEAAREFSRALLADEDNMKALELLANCHYQLNEIELAAAEAARVQHAQPEDPSAVLLLGTCFLRLGQYKEAIPLLYFSVLKANLPQTHLLLGEAFLGVKAYNNALKEFLAAQAASPDIPGLHNDLGTAHAGLGQPDQAQAEFEKQLAVTPNDFEANYYLGRLKRLANDPEAAKQFLAKADRARPGDPSVAYEYAAFALQDKNYTKAEELLRGVLDKVPNYMDAHVLLAEVYYKLRRPDDARREKAIAEALKNAEQKEESAGGKPPEQPAKPTGQ